jgi:hypothetical protein
MSDTHVGDGRADLVFTHHMAHFVRSPSHQDTDKHPLEGIPIDAGFYLFDSIALFVVMRARIQIGWNYRLVALTFHGCCF